MLTWFNNLKMGIKLIFAFTGMVITIGGVLGGLGYYNLTHVNQIILEIAGQRIPTVKSATAVERLALHTIQSEKMYLLANNDVRLDADSYQKQVLSQIDQVNTALNEVDRIANQFNDPDLQARSKDMRTVTAQYRDMYNNMVTSQQSNKTAVQTMNENGQKLVSLSQAYYQKLVSKSPQNTTAGSKAPDAKEQALAQKQISRILDVWTASLDARLNQNQYMLYKDVQYFTAMQKDITKISARFDDLQSDTSDAQDLQALKQARQAMDDYYKAAQEWVNNDGNLKVSLDQMDTIGTSVQDSAIKAEESGWAAVQTSQVNSANIVPQAIQITFAAVAIAMLLGILFGLLIARSITIPLASLVQAARQLSTGNLLRDLSREEKLGILRRHDEIGEIGKAIGRLVDYLQEMGNAANSIAQNDLTIDVTPKSENDELGNAFSSMLKGLRETARLLAENALKLRDASNQLAEAANEAGNATDQIASTIMEVARGIQEQTNGISRTANSVDQMTRAINGVANGAQEQSIAVNKTAEITSRMSQAIRQVSDNAEAVTHESAKAAEAAQKGSMTVEETLQGMQSIKNKVALSAQKVQEMGQRSNEIGVIVETIDDIASQTNLLALNAAIEAARAGEHGKGFAVVADEVRKLAERSSVATKEIGKLVTSIQSTVNEAIKAMQEGSKEVEAGVNYSNQAGQALNAILEAAEAVNRQAQLASQTSKEILDASNEVVSAVDSVSAVVEENTAATEEMTASSNEVTAAIENIASVSEENSAAVEEVSASAEEMSAQVQELTQSAQGLANMAQALETIVEKFKLNNGSPARP